MDNNWVERLMKRIAVGKKNWRFVGSQRAGIRNANFTSLVASTHRRDLDVYAYFTDVITHLNRCTARRGIVAGCLERKPPGRNSHVSRGRTT